MMQKIRKQLERIADSIEKGRVQPTNTQVEERLAAVEVKLAQLWGMLTQSSPRNPDSAQLNKVGRTWKDWLKGGNNRAV